MRLSKLYETHLNAFSVARTNGLGRFVLGSSATLCEARGYEVSKEDLGGIIVFSTDVNVTVNQGGSLYQNLVNWVLAKANSYWNRLTSHKRVLDILDKLGISGVSFGNYFRGRYKADDGRVFDERSLAIEVLFVSSEQLQELATMIAREFKQETVLVKDNVSGDVYFANRN